MGLAAEQPGSMIGTRRRRPAAGPERALTPTGRRPLDRSLILREAVRFIDAYGRDRLTMRGLGAQLGVEAMALYRYVPGRDQLLDGVVETVLDDLYLTTLRLDRPGTWQEFLQQMAHAVRAIAIEHPRIFPLVTSRPPAAPWLRPPLRSLRLVEAFLQGLRHYGISGRDSVLVYRSFCTFLLGHLLLESTRHALEPRGRLGSDLAPVGADDLAGYPRLAELAADLSLDSFDDEFQASLLELIDRMAVRPR